jgi:hypothetical protein
MKRILYLSFLYEPDLSACSFRNSTLSKELAKQLEGKDCEIDLYTTMPNRYITFSKEADLIQKNSNLTIFRINIPAHNSGFIDQIKSFKTFYFNVLNATKNKNYDLVFVSTGRFFSSYLGYRIAKRNNAHLYLDIRDIFVDTIGDVIKSHLANLLLIPILKKFESSVFNYASHINLISGGFKEYFKEYKNTNYSNFTNGIDDEFIVDRSTDKKLNITRPYTILYAGNFGEGQGLHKIIPKAAHLLGDNYKFILIGDGGSKYKLLYEINNLQLKNVIIRNPIARKELLTEYLNADILFVHLNDYNAFKKVLPSKLFELATFNKPIFAGVAGYAKEFIENEISDSIVFQPCDVNQFVNQLTNFKYPDYINRNNFLNKFKRSEINILMAKSISSYLN